jgi:plasmid stabilization system protein ParE
MPQKYRLINDRYFASRGMRKMNVENYIAFFVINEKLNTVKVVRIFHSKRDWERLLPEQ